MPRPRRFKTNAERQRAYRRRRAARRADQLRVWLQLQGRDLPDGWQPTAAHWGRYGNLIKAAKRRHNVEPHGWGEHDDCYFCLLERDH